MLKPAHWLIIGGGLLLIAAIKLTLFVRVNSALRRQGQTAKKSKPAPPDQGGA